MTVETSATAQRDDVVLSASVDTRKLPAVSIIAYTGGIMKVPGWGDIVIDLAGLDVAGSVAILSDHDSTRFGIVGHGSAEVRSGQLVVTGSISAAGRAAKEIVDAAKNGFPWAASVGVQVMEKRVVRPGEKVAVNGRNIDAGSSGFTLVTKGKLREVSIVGIGCDAATSVAIAASRTRGMGMDAATDEKQEKLEAAERTRVANIASICGTTHDDIKASAIEQGWDESRVELEVLRADRPKPPAVWERGPVVATGSVLEAAVLRRMGKASIAEKALGPMALEQAERLGATNMIDLCRAALLADGQSIPSDRMALVKAALSTLSLPTVLGNVANKVLLDAYNETPSVWRLFCSIRPVSDFKPHTGVRPSFTGQLERVAPGGELKHGGITEALVGFQADTFGKMLSVDRKHIIDDDLSIFQDTASAYGRMGMRRVSDLVIEVLLANADGFFSPGNGNYLDGADSALTPESLAKAITLMRTQRDAEGNDLDILPATLVVGPEQETLARAILQSEFIQVALNMPTGNGLRAVVTPAVESRLSNALKFGNKASTKHWFLFASASAAPMIVCFLDGKQAPTVEFFGLDADASRLAVSWRVYFDFGAGFCDPRAAVRSKGEA